MTIATNITTAPPLIDDVDDLDHTDLECFADIATVLRRYGKIDRFDIALRHRHFDLADGELMIETNDPASRTLLIEPHRAESLPDGVRVRETLWSLGDTEASQRCRQGCFVDLRDKHSAKHVYRR